jgi:hypothetical protein
MTAGNGNPNTNLITWRTDMTAEQKEIIELLNKEKRGEISYKDLYLRLQKYPVEVRDRTLALYILED